MYDAVVSAKSQIVIPAELRRKYGIKPGTKICFLERGRLEGAFLNALVAVAATSRRQFPDHKTVSDREAFERFLASAHRVRLSVEYRGECYPVEHILYKWFRCELVHEGGLPIDIEFIPDSEPGALSVRASGAPEYILKVSHGWFHHLINAVVSAPVNAGLFPSTRSRQRC